MYVSKTNLLSFNIRNTSVFLQKKIYLKSKNKNYGLISITINFIWFIDFGLYHPQNQNTKIRFDIFKNTKELKIFK